MSFKNINYDRTAFAGFLCGMPHALAVVIYGERDIWHIHIVLFFSFTSKSVFVELDFSPAGHYIKPSGVAAPHFLP